MHHYIFFIVRLPVPNDIIFIIFISFGYQYKTIYKNIFLNVHVFIFVLLSGLFLQVHQVKRGKCSYKEIPYNALVGFFLMLHQSH